MTMDIEAMLASRAALVEKELEALSAESDPDYGIVCDAMRYSLLVGGKETASLSRHGVRVARVESVGYRPREGG